MNNALQEIVNAVLYEGHVLYPYRASSPRNLRERFTFGRVCPEIYSQKQNGRELCRIQAEVLLETHNELPDLKITLGFLQPIRREIGVLPKPVQTLASNDDPGINVIPTLELNGKLYQTGMEAAERQVSIPLKTLQGSVEALFNFEAQCLTEPIFDEHGLIAAVVRRNQSAISGKVIVKSHFLKNGLSKISVTVLNQSPLEETGRDVPDKVLMSTLASSHVIFQAKRGQFISLLETPDELKFFSNQCHNLGVWPVLVGDKSQAERSLMLASPIILCDYPQISPNSARDLFDETEIDEMLTLRVLTMLEAGKHEVQPGHSFFYRADEVEPRKLEMAS